MIRAVFFDMGGVLLRTEDDSARRSWEQQLGLAPRALDAVVFENPVAARATLGQATTGEVWAEVGRRLMLNRKQLAHLRRDFFSGDRFDETLLAYLRTLRPRYRTGLLSNAWPDVPNATRHYLNENLFDTLVFSCREGVAKPAPEIYQRALHRLEVAPAEAVFVDDFAINLEGAQAVGLRTVHFKNTAQARAELQTLLAQPA